MGTGSPNLRQRAGAVGIALMLGFAGVGFRLVLLQVFERGELTARADRQQRKVVELPAVRGAIYDRQRRELAVSVEASSLYAVPSKVADPRGLARRLAPVIGQPAALVERRLTGGGSFVWLARKVTPDVPPRVERLGGDDGALGWLTDSRRYYPNKTLAAHVIGFTGTDNEGLEGLEAKYDGPISGTPGRAVVERDGSGRELFHMDEGLVAPVPGGDVVLTIDEKVQHIVEKELDRLMEEYSPAGACAIVTDPKSGEVLAMANRPGYNPNDWRAYRPERWRNRAVSDIYEPGSTFKVVAAAAALEEGVVKPSERIDCGGGKVVVGGRVIHDSHPVEGSLSFAEVIQKSSNVGTVKVAQRLGPQRLHEYARRFGFGEKTGVDLPGEASGTLREVKGWSGVSIASVAIGQEVGVTPLQMLAAMNAIANGGVYQRPYVVAEITGEGGLPLRRALTGKGRRVVSRATASKLTEMLAGVVEDGGTASLANVRGYKVAGKTGTAQKYDPAIGRYSREKYVSSFVGFVPADEPRISVIVVVDEPKGEIYGGRVAAPAFKAIVEQTMNYLRVPTRLPEQVLLVER